MGCAFLFLAALLPLGTRAIAGIGAALVLFHGLADDVGQESFGRAGFLYGLLHQAGGIELPWRGRGGRDGNGPTPRPRDRIPPSSTRDRIGDGAGGIPLPP